MKEYNNNIMKIKRWLEMSLILILGVYLLVGCGKIIQKFGAKSKEQDVKRSEFKDFQTGDIIFHTSKSNQSQPIRLATNSKFSHIGIIEVSNNKVKVIEAVESVKKSDIKEWIKRGINEDFAVARLKEEYHPDIPNVIKEADKYLGKPYDLTFNWDDDKIYCSELVYKAFYKGINIKLGTLTRLKELDIEQVKEKVEERYVENIPYNLEVITPQSIFDSEKIKVIYTTYKEYGQTLEEKESNLCTKKVIRFFNFKPLVKEKTVEQKVREIIGRMEEYCIEAEKQRVDTMGLELMLYPEMCRLIEIGKTGAPLMIEIVKNKEKHPHFRNTLFHVISNVDEKAMVEPVLSILMDKSDNECVRAETLNVLAGNVDNELFIKLLKTEKSNIIREEIINTFGFVGDEKVLTLLITILKDKDEDDGIRARSAMALTDIGVRTGDKRMVDPMIELLKNTREEEKGELPSSGVYICTLYSLGRLKDKRAVDSLIKELKEGSIGAAEALGNLGKDIEGNERNKIVEALIEGLKHEDELVIRKSAKALGKIGDKRAVGPLIDAFKKEEGFGGRRIIAWQLGILGNKMAVKPLENALNDPINDNIKIDIARTLKQLTGKDYQY